MEKKYISLLISLGCLVVSAVIYFVDRQPIGSEDEDHIEIRRTVLEKELNESYGDYQYYSRKLDLLKSNPKVPLEQNQIKNYNSEREKAQSANDFLGYLKSESSPSEKPGISYMTYKKLNGLDSVKTFKFIKSRESHPEPTNMIPEDLKNRISRKVISKDKRVLVSVMVAYGIMELKKSEGSHGYDWHLGALMFISVFFFLKYLQEIKVLRL